MPSIETLLNPALSALWREYFTLLDGLRTRAVWRHEEDGEPRPNGAQRPPRFVAVVEDSTRFAHLQEQVAAFADLNTKWPVQLFDEVWGWGRVSVGTGTHSRRLEAGHAADVGAVKDTGAALRLVAILEASGHQASVIDGRLVVTPNLDGLTMRTTGGRAFRLSAWDESGTLLHSKLSVGAVVCRGVRQGIHENSGPRKTRSDTLEMVASWEGVTFWTAKNN